MPHNTTWGMIASAAVLGGIGFTVSLFIANLTFDQSVAVESALLDRAKLGIVVGSLIAGVGGYFLLHATCPHSSNKSDE